MRLSLVFLFLLLTLLPASTQKVLVDLTTGDLETIKTRLLSGLPGVAKHFKQSGDDVEIAVVIHGDAYKFFVENLENTKFWADEQLANAQDELRQKLGALRKEYGIVFEMCQVGMNRRGILSEDIYKFVTPIPSAMIGLVKWQNMGYAYIPVH